MRVKRKSARTLRVERRERQTIYNQENRSTVAMSFNYNPPDPSHRDDKPNPGPIPRLPTPVANIREDKPPVPRMPTQLVTVRDEKGVTMTRITQSLMTTPDIVKASAIQNVTNLPKPTTVVAKPLIPQQQQPGTHTLHIGVGKTATIGGKPLMTPHQPGQIQAAMPAHQVLATAAPLQKVPTIAGTIKPKQKGLMSMQQTDVHPQLPGQVTTVPTQQTPISTVQQSLHPQPLVASQMPTSLTHQSHPLPTQLHQPHIGSHHPGMISSIISASQKPTIPQRVVTPPQPHLAGLPFSTHLPRGAAAVASVLTAPKGSVATAVRPSVAQTTDHRSLSSVAHPATTVQITIQPPRTNIEIHRQVIPQYSAAHGTGTLTASKPVHLSQPMQQALPTQKLVISSAPVSAIGHQTVATVSIPKTVVTLSTTTSAPVITTTSTVVTPVSIPIAKVHPQRQQQIHPIQTTAEFTRIEATVPSTAAAGGLFLSQAHRATTSTLPSSVATTVATHTDPHPRPMQQQQQQQQQQQVLNRFMSVPYSQFEYLQQSYQNMPTTLMQYSQIAGSQPPFAAATSGASTRPSIVTPSQTPNLTATLQARTIAVTTATAVKMTPVMVSMEPKPPRQLSIRTPHTTTAEVLTAIGDSTLPSQTNPGTILGLASQQQQPTTLLPSTTTLSSAAAAAAATNLNASPRPSILRKRPNEGPIIVKKTLNLSDSATSSPKADSAPMSATSSPKPIIDACSRESSQSSTDTASSAENSNQSPPVALQAAEVKIKQEPMDTSENGSVLSSMASTPLLSQPNSVEASPRKKPRKQLLNANEELKDEPISSDNDDLLDSSFDNDGDKDSFIDDEGTRWVSMRRRNQVALLNFYSCTWKAKNNHFYRQADVKIKDERRPTVNELSNQKGIMQKASGWKLYHMAAQLEDMNDCEKDVKSKMGEVKESLLPVMDDEMIRVHDLTQGNVQRSQLIVDQLEEAKNSMIKILDHKQRIMEIVNKHHSKRPVKKKERS